MYTIKVRLKWTYGCHKYFLQHLRLECIIFRENTNFNSNFGQFLGKILQKLISGGTTIRDSTVITSTKTVQRG